MSTAIRPADLGRSSRVVSLNSVTVGDPTSKKGLTMIKRAFAVAGATALILGSSMGAASAANSGKAYGKNAQMCVAALDAPSLGAAIQAGKAAHPGAKMTAKTIAMSVHCE